MIYKMNYDKLKNLKESKLYLILIIFLIIVLSLLILASIYQIPKVITSFGIYEDGVLKIEINTKLSDKIKNNNTLEFNGTKTQYQIKDYGEYRLVDNEIYQELDLIIDRNFYSHETGIVEFYDEEKIINYIWTLFK